MSEKDSLNSLDSTLTGEVSDLSSPETAAVYPVPPVSSKRQSRKKEVDRPFNSRKDFDLAMENEILTLLEGELSIKDDILYIGKSSIFDTYIGYSPLRPMELLFSDNWSTLLDGDPYRRKLPVARDKYLVEKAKSIYVNLRSSERDNTVFYILKYGHVSDDLSLLESTFFIKPKTYPKDLKPSTLSKWIASNYKIILTKRAITLLTHPDTDPPTPIWELASVLTETGGKYKHYNAGEWFGAVYDYLLDMDGLLPHVSLARAARLSGGKISTEKSADSIYHYVMSSTHNYCSKYGEDISNKFPSLISNPVNKLTVDELFHVVDTVLAYVDTLKKGAPPIISSDINAED